MDINEKLNSVSRRDLIKMFGTFGVTSTMLAAASLGGVITTTRLAQAANSMFEKRFKKPAKYTFKLGGSAMNENSLRIMRIGTYEFIRDVEERTDGAVRIEFIGNAQMCTDLTCLRKAQQGIIDMFMCATQNAAASAVYYNVLDFPYMFKSEAAMNYFLCSPKSDALLREKVRKMHGIEILSVHPLFRSVSLSLKYRDQPIVKTVEQLKGLKVRVSGSALGTIGLQQLGFAPVPLDWSETPDALRQGLVDGLEASSSGNVFAGLIPNIGQVLEIGGIFPCSQHIAITSKKFNAMEPELQEALMESGYYTQSYIAGASVATDALVVGRTEPPLPTSAYGKNNVKVSFFSEEELEKCRKLASPEFNPEPYKEWRSRLDKMAGCDIFNEIRKVADELPKGETLFQMENRRWWKSGE